MIHLFTDYGCNDFYAGQLRAVIWTHAPGVEVVDFLHNAPQFNIGASAHLLAALSAQFTVGSVCLAIVDPGVGTQRDAVVLLADEKWYIGPDNGLLSVVAARAAHCEVWRIIWRPVRLSKSFHGRDLFAPVAAWIEKGDFPHGKLADVAGLQVLLDSSDLPEIVYIDHYGNAMTGIRAGTLASDALLQAGGGVLSYASVFAEVEQGVAFWYENSIGLIEIAVNAGSAAAQLGLKVGDPVRL